MTNIDKFLHLIDITIGDKEKIETEMNAATGIIVKEGENGERKILIIKRADGDSWSGMWELPRGKCDKGKNEDTVHCVKREVKEETGLDVDVVRLIDTFEYLADGGTRRTTSYNYLCVQKNPTQEVKLSREHTSYKWITQLGEAELLIPPEQKKTLEMILSKENPIVTYPDNNFTQNNNLEEYINRLQK